MKIGKERAKGFGKNIIKGSVDVSMWRPKDGSHIIDIIPYACGDRDPDLDKGEDNYTFEYFVHTQVGPGNAWFLCPAQMYGDPCPICEHRDKLREKGANKKIWKPLFPRRRNLYNIISYDRGEERKGLQVWDVPWYYSEKNLMAIAIKKDRKGREREINFAHATKGKSISFNIEPPKSKDDYASYEGFSFDDRDDYKIKGKTLDAAQTLDEIVTIPGYKEIKEAYWKGGGPKDREEEHEKTDDELQDLLEELEDLDDMDDLEEFIDDNDLDIKIKKKDDEDDVKEKIVEALEEEYEDTGGDDNGGDDNGGDDNGDDDEKLVRKINKMSEKKLTRYIDNEDIDVDPDDADDVEELRELVIEELDLE